MMYVSNRPKALFPLSLLLPGSPHSDVVTVPNVPLFSAGFMMRDADPVTLMGFKAATGGMDAPMFQTKSVQGKGRRRLRGGGVAAYHRSLVTSCRSTVTNSASWYVYSISRKSGSKYRYDFTRSS